MPHYTIQVTVLPRPVLLDPEGETITRAAHRLGYTDIQRIRAGRTFSLEIEAGTLEEARHTADRLARQLLHNPVVEVYTISVEPASLPVSGIGQAAS